MSGDTRRRSLREIQEVIAGLRAEVEAPDLSQAILSRVHSERPFLARRPRRWLGPARVACLGVCLAVVLGVVLVQRSQPEATVWAGKPAVFSDVVGCVECEAERLRSVQELRLAVAGMTRSPEALRQPGAISGPADSSIRPAVASGDPAIVEPAATIDPRAIAGMTPADRLDDVTGDVRVSWSGSSTRGNQRNFLRELGPLLTGQPAGEWMNPK